MKESSNYDHSVRLPLGEEGRIELKAAIRQVLKTKPYLREQVNKVANLRCATIPQLLKIASLCNLWTMALKISEKFVDSKSFKHTKTIIRKKKLIDNYYMHQNPNVIRYEHGKPINNAIIDPLISSNICLISNNENLYTYYNLPIDEFLDGNDAIISTHEMNINYLEDVDKLLNRTETKKNTKQKTKVKANDSNHRQVKKNTNSNEIIDVHNSSLYDNYSSVMTELHNNEDYDVPYNFILNSYHVDYLQNSNYSAVQASSENYMLLFDHNPNSYNEFIQPMNTYSTEPNILYKNPTLYQDGTNI